MRRAVVLLLAAVLAAGSAGVYAAGGSASDPLISLDYLEQTYTPEVIKQAQDKIDSGLDGIYQTALSDLKAKHNAYLTQAGRKGGNGSSALTDQRYKRGDVISLSTGSGVMLLAGSASAGYTSSGAVIDVTLGQTLDQGTALSARHRYLVAENTTAAITVTSDTAVISTEGAFTLSPSSTTDYNALAEALMDMGLFRGSDIGYGSGYNLEAVPTRIEGLVMFLRLIGEEPAALAYTGENPFVDTPAWCERYTAYAYAKGYTKGVGTSASGQMYFGTSTVMSSGEYMTFLLRALGYSDSGASPDFSWSNAVSRSVELGVLNTAEQKQFSQSPFLRAQVVYASYFALSAPRKAGGTMLSGLTASGALDATKVNSVMPGVSVARMS